VIKAGVLVCRITAGPVGRIAERGVIVSSLWYSRSYCNSEEIRSRAFNCRTCFKHMRFRKLVCYNSCPYISLMISGSRHLIVSRHLFDLLKFPPRNVFTVLVGKRPHGSCISNDNIECILKKLSCCDVQYWIQILQNRLKFRDLL
jgi:hypothetical protein